MGCYIGDIICITNNNILKTNVLQRVPKQKHCTGFRIYTFVNPSLITNVIWKYVKIALLLLIGEFTKIHLTKTKQSPTEIRVFMNKRLLQFLDSQGLTQSQLSSILGVAGSSISHIISGRNKPSLDFIESLMTSFPTLNIEWFIKGDGPMYKGTAANLTVPGKNGADSPSPTSTSNDDGYLFEEYKPTEVQEVKEISSGENASPEAKSLYPNEATTTRSQATPSLQITNHNKLSNRVLKTIILFEDGSFQELVSY